MWRLRHAVELRRHRPRRDGIRAQARHRPDRLQQGLLLLEGLLSQLRDGHRRYAEGQGRREGRSNAAHA